MFSYIERVRILYDEVLGSYKLRGYARHLQNLYSQLVTSVRLRQNEAGFTDKLRRSVLSYARLQIITRANRQELVHQTRTYLAQSQTSRRLVRYLF